MRTVRLAAMLAALVACDDDPVTDPDLHRIVPCSAEWATAVGGNPQPVECETPCASPGNYRPAHEPDDRRLCAAKYANNQDVRTCYETTLFEHDDIRGCCDVVDLGGFTSRKYTAVFAVCVEDL
jgi:hypothetical protein